VISYRQARRIHRRYLKGGDGGLIHRSRGRPTNRGKFREVKEAVLRLYQERYWGFGPTIAAEKLHERDDYHVGHETLRRWLMNAGLWERHRKRPKHRKRRERKAHFGELVQMDGSHHQWFSGHKGKGCLMDMVDDVTGITLALMRREETTKAAAKALQLEGIQDIPAANAFLAGYEETLNGKFAVEPGSPADFHQPVPEGLDLRNVFCMEETHVISDDWVVRYKNRFFQIVPQSKLPPARNKVTVQEHLDGSIHILYGGKEVRFTEVSDLPACPPPPTLRRPMSLLRTIHGEDSILGTWGENRQP